MIVAAKRTAAIKLSLLVYYAGTLMPHYQVLMDEPCHMLCDYHQWNRK